MNLASLMGSGLLAASVLLGWQWPEFRGPDGRGMASRIRPSAPMERDRGSAMEDGGARPRLVVPGRARWPGMADLGDRRRTAALRDGVRRRDRPGRPRPEALRRVHAAIRAPLQHVRLADAGDRAGPRLRDLRLGRHGGARHGDGQGRSGSGAISSAITTVAPGRRRFSSAICCCCTTTAAISSTRSRSTSARARPSGRRRGPLTSRIWARTASRRPRATCARPFRRRRSSRWMARR